MFLHVIERSETKDGTLKPARRLPLILLFACAVAAMSESLWTEKSDEWSDVQKVHGSGSINVGFVFKSSTRQHLDERPDIKKVNCHVAVDITNGKVVGSCNVGWC